MKKPLLFLSILCLLVLFACKEQADSDSEAVAEEETVVEKETKMKDAPDYEAFNSKVETIRAFMKAHENEDLAAQTEMIADTLKWSPPQYNGNQVLSKSDYIAALEGYHQNFENIKFEEGIKMGDIDEGGFWSGSVYPENSANVQPDAIRVYGTWTATHTESGKEIGVKWFGIAWVNDDNKLAMMTEYWDVNGLAAQIAEE